jgi:MFS family permease
MPTKRTSLFIFPLLSTLFCFSMFYRLTNAVIAPDLIREFHLNAERLGMLSSAFFYTFALFQIPMGVLLDRIGPRKVITLFTLVGAAGAFVFACAGGFYMALAGRALLGIGMASALMGSFKVFVNRYPPRRFSTLSGAILSIGTLGPILATSPLVYLNSINGCPRFFALLGIGRKGSRARKGDFGLRLCGAAHRGYQIAPMGLRHPFLLADKLLGIFSIRRLCSLTGGMARPLSHGHQGV